MVADSDPALVDLILRNLVSNAIRYTDRGGVLVGCRQRGDKVVVEVCDTGIGIAPENQQDIFREFHQLGNPERDRRKGLGLGLAIVQGLTHTLGHRLTLSSIPGRGSVFRLELPLVNKLYPLEIDRPQAVEFTTPLRGYHALVIEDDDIVLQAGGSGRFVQSAVVIAAPGITPGSSNAYGYKQFIAQAGHCLDSWLTIQSSIHLAPHTADDLLDTQFVGGLGQINIAEQFNQSRHAQQFT